MKRKRILASLGTVMLVLVACGPQAGATPTATPTATLSPTAAPRPTAAVTGATPTAVLRALPTATSMAVPTPTRAAAPAGTKMGGTLRLPQRSDPPSWDLTISYHDPTTTTRSVVFSRLFTAWSDPPKNCQQSVQPQAVKDWRWVDDLTAEFSLKPGIRYHNKAPVNGREAIASDVPPTFERYRNLAPMAAYSAQVDSVVALDRYTFRVKTRVPFGGLVSEFFASYYGPWIEPPEVGGPDGQWWTVPEKSWIGTGPFLFKEWRPGVKWTLARNPNYWVQGRPYLDAIEVYVMPDVSAIIAGLRSKKLDMDRDLSQIHVAELKRTNPELQVIRCPGAFAGGAQILFMNNSTPPFDNVLVRRAASMAIDREALIKLHGGAAQWSPVLPLSVASAMAKADFPPELQEYLTYSPAKARELMAKAGHPQGVDSAIVWHLRYASPSREIAEAVQSMLQQVGIRAKLQIMDYTLWISWINRPFAFGPGVMAMSPALGTSAGVSDALPSFWSKERTRNRSAVSDPEYDKLFEEFFSSRDEAKRLALSRQMQLMAVEKMYRLLLPYPDSTLVAQPGVHYTWIGNTRDYGVFLETMWKE